MRRVDGLVGGLRKDIQALSLPVNFIVVSDHGMQSTAGFVNLSDYADLSKVKVENSGAFALLYAPSVATAEQTYRDLHGKSPKFHVYRRRETPPQWHYPDNARIGDWFGKERGQQKAARESAPAGQQGSPQGAPTFLSAIVNAIAHTSRQNVGAPV